MTVPIITPPEKKIMTLDNVPSFPNVGDIIPAQIPGAYCQRVENDPRGNPQWAFRGWQYALKGDPGTNGKDGTNGLNGNAHVFMDRDPTSDDNIQGALPVLWTNRLTQKVWSNPTDSGGAGNKWVVVNDPQAVVWSPRRIMITDQTSPDPGCQFLLGQDYDMKQYPNVAKYWTKGVLDCPWGNRVLRLHGPDTGDVGTTTEDASRNATGYLNGAKQFYIDSGGVLKGSWASGGGNGGSGDTGILSSNFDLSYQIPTAGEVRVKSYTVRGMIYMS